MAKVTIAGVRVTMGWTQAELAKKLGVSRATVIKWETNKREMKPAYLYLFCQLTGFSEDDILLPKKSTMS